MSKQVKSYMADISFLQPVIDGYKLGLFADKNLPVRITNALDSLSCYGNVQQYVEVPDFKKPLTRKKYTKKSAYWNKSAQSVDRSEDKA